MADLTRELPPSFPDVMDPGTSATWIEENYHVPHDPLENFAHSVAHHVTRLMQCAPGGGRGGRAMARGRRGGECSAKETP
jgi:hypothetical protein